MTLLTGWGQISPSSPARIETLAPMTAGSCTTPGT
jgi:hypothetical protein